MKDELRQAREGMVMWQNAAMNLEERLASAEGQLKAIIEWTGALQSESETIYCLKEIARAYFQKYGGE